MKSEILHKKKEGRNLVFHMISETNDLGLLSGFTPIESNDKVKKNYLSATLTSSGPMKEDNVPVKPIGSMSPIGFVMDESELCLVHADFMPLESYGEMPHDEIQKKDLCVNDGEEDRTLQSKYPNKKGHVRYWGGRIF